MKRRKTVLSSMLSDSMTIAPSSMTLQGICLVSLVGNLSDADISAVQKAFKAEAVLREGRRVTGIVQAALPTWTTIDGFEVMTQNISGTLRGLKLVGTTLSSAGYASFVIRDGYVTFNADAKKAIKVSGGIYPRYNQLHYTDSVLSVFLGKVLGVLVSKDIDHAALIKELLLFMKKKRTLLNKQQNEEEEEISE